MPNVFRVLTRFGGCDFHRTRTVSHTFFRLMEKELKFIIQECLVYPEPDTLQIHFKQLLVVPGMHLLALDEIIVLVASVFNTVM